MTDTLAIKEALQRILDVDIAADRWDEAPSLVLIIGHDGSPEFTPVPVGDEGWQAAEPYRVIRAAANAAKVMNERLGWNPFAPDEQLLGVALFTEGWGVTEHSAEAASAIEQWLQDGHRLSEHPLSVELKMVTAVFHEDPPIMLVHPRDGDPMPEADTGNIAGRVPDALTYLLTTFQELE